MEKFLVCLGEGLKNKERQGQTGVLCVGVEADVFENIITWRKQRLLLITTIFPT